MADEPTLTQSETEPASTTDERPALELPQEEKVADAPLQERAEQEETEEREPVELPEGWQDNDEVKAGLTSAREEAKEEGKREQQGSKDREIRELRVTHAEALETSARDATSSSIVRGVDDIVQTLTRKLKAEGNSAAEVKDEIEELMGQNASWAAAFDTASHAASRQTGENEGMAHASRLLYGGLNKADSAKFADFTRDLDTSIRLKEITWDKAFDKALTRRDEYIRADEAGKLEKLSSERETEEKKAAERNGKKPATAVTGRSGGGGAKPDSVLRSSSSTIEEKEAAFKEKHGFDIKGAVSMT